MTFRVLRLVRSRGNEGGVSPELALVPLLLSLAASCGGRVFLDGGSGGMGGTGGTGGTGGAGGGGATCEGDFILFAAGLSTPTGIAADALGVVWTSDGELWRAGPSGEDAAVLATGLEQPWAVALDGDDVFVAGYASSLSRFRRSTGELVWALETIACGPSVSCPLAAYDVALDPTHVFFVGNLGGFRVDRESGVTLDALTMDATPGDSLVRDATHTYVLQRTPAGVALRRTTEGLPYEPLVEIASDLDCSGCGAPGGFLDRVTVTSDHAWLAVGGSLVRLPKAGGAPEVVLQGAAYVHAVASAGGTVFVGFTEPSGDGVIARVDPTTLEQVELLREPSLVPWSMAPSAAGVYWSSYEVGGPVGRTCGL